VNTDQLEKQWIKGVKMKKTGLTIMMLSMCILMFAAELTIQRERSVLREGPGSWHKVLAELPIGSRVSTIDNDTDDTDSDQWIKVQTGTKTGYISESSTKKLPPKNNVFAAMAKQKTDVTSSRHGVSAGVKGFGERFSKTFRGDVSFVELAATYQMDARSYKQFKKESYKGMNIKKIKNSVVFPKKLPSEYFSFSEEGFGLGVASAIASQGLYKDEALHQYINHLGNQIAEASNASDIEFKFFVLNLEAANAYACPGGYVFVTKGMIKQCDNEAELAVVLAHEIIHVVFSHGMKELEKRKNKVMADQMFDEMDEEMPTEDEEIALTEKEMEDEAFSMYETIIKGRLDAYEQEADEMGMLLTARAGYNPVVLSSLLNRLNRSSMESNNQHYRKENIQQRMVWVDKFIAKNKFPAQLLYNKDRFTSMKARIR